MEIGIILAVAAIAANIYLIRYIKKSNRHRSGAASDQNNKSGVRSRGYLNTPEVRKLKESAAAELGVSMEELDNIIAKEIEKIGGEKKNTNIH